MFVYRSQTVDARFICQAFPPDDQQLSQWLQEEYSTGDVRVSRKADQLAIQVDSYGRPKLDTKEMPLEKFGYTLAATHSVSYSSQPSTTRFALTILCATLTIVSAMRGQQTALEILPSREDDDPSRSDHPTNA